MQCEQINPEIDEGAKRFKKKKGAEIIMGSQSVLPVGNTFEANQPCSSSPGIP